MKKALLYFFGLSLILLTGSTALLPSSANALSFTPPMEEHLLSCTGYGDHASCTVQIWALNNDVDTIRSMSIANPDPSHYTFTDISEQYEIIDNNIVVSAMDGANPREIVFTFDTTNVSGTTVYWNYTFWPDYDRTGDSAGSSGAGLVTVGYELDPPVEPPTTGGGFLIPKGEDTTEAIGHVVGGATETITDNLGVVLGVVAFGVGVGFIYKNLRKSAVGHYESEWSEKDKDIDSEANYEEHVKAGMAAGLSRSEADEYAEGFED